MNQADDSTKKKKWKDLNEHERCKIEVLLKASHTVKDIANELTRDRRTIEREIKKGTVTKQIENPYVSRNQKVPDYLTKTFYLADKAPKYDKDFPKIFKSITMDNDNESLDQLGIEASIIVEENKRTICFYAHPYSSWERGSNENANKLIRRFIPKGSNIDDVRKSKFKRYKTG